MHTSQDRIYLYHLKNLLESEGIECLIKNDNLSSLAGELPMTIIWPELWIKDSIHALHAKAIIENSQKQTLSDAKSWVCKNCGEKHSAQFTDCWNCQSVKSF